LRLFSCPKHRCIKEHIGNKVNGFWQPPGGLSNFDTLHARGHDDQVFLYAFDLLELNGEDLRTQPLEARKGRLERLVANASCGLRFVEHKDLSYRSGPSKSWLKTKNPAAPAALRIIEEGSWYVGSKK
jgi:ATP-dependent DNA ligase